jgi:hypothetical protein|tara:strand:+ start:360 stop:491 length:132 start_codon:yes stop_codon:yes gene_type:complete
MNNISYSRRWPFSYTSSKPLLQLAYEGLLEQVEGIVDVKVALL